MSDANGSRPEVFDHDAVNKAIPDIAADDYIDLISQIPCGIAIFHLADADFCLDFVNEGFLSVHHRADKTVRDYIGSGSLKFVYEPDRERIKEAYARIEGKAKLTGSADYRVAGSDGQLHWVSFRFRAAYVKDGTQYYYGAYSGLDTQKRTEEKLEESRGNLEESMLNTDLQFFTYFPGRARCENYRLNSRFSGLPTVWEHYPDDFLAYAQVPGEDAKVYREMVAAIDRGEDRAECTVRFAYRGSLIWEKSR